MRKTLFTLAVMLVVSFTIKAQEFDKGDWEIGPKIGLSGEFGYATKSYNKANFFISFKGGAYGSYAFTDIIKGIGEIDYNYKTSFGGGWHYLNIPALVCFQIGKGHLGVGAQYSINLATPKSYIKYGNGQLSYPSAIMEVSYKTKWGRSGNFMIYSEEGFTNIIRIGYAFIPISYSLQDGIVDNYKYYPFFIEMLLRFDIGQYFSNNSAKSNRRRR